jgi:hypothetical protein
MPRSSIRTGTTKLIAASRNGVNAPKTCHHGSRIGPTHPDSSGRGILLTFQVNVPAALLQFNIMLQRTEYEKQKNYATLKLEAHQFWPPGRRAD